MRRGGWGGSRGARAGEGVTGPAMADNEKLDNQRLKNFKNKGRDLEDNFSVEKNTPGVRGHPGDANSAFQRPVFYSGYS